MIKTYTYKIKPNKKVEQKFNHYVGICRYVFNVSKQLKEVSYRHGLKLSAYDIQKQLTDAKKEHTFLKEVHSQTLQAIIERLDNSFKKFLLNLPPGLLTSSRCNHTFPASMNAAQ